MSLNPCTPNCSGGSCSDNGCGGTCEPCTTPNGPCSAANPINPAGGSVTQELAIGALLQGTESWWPNGCPGSANMEWQAIVNGSDVFSFTPTTAGKYSVELVPEPAWAQTAMRVVTDCASTDTTCLGWKTGNPLAYEQVPMVLTLELSQGETYYISIGEITPTTDYTLSVLPCVADCAGKACGGDGCGGSCGSCDTGQACSAGSCEPATAGSSCETPVALNSDSFPISMPVDFSDNEFIVGQPPCPYPIYEPFGPERTQEALSLTATEAGVYRVSFESLRAEPTFWHSDQCPQPELSCPDATAATTTIDGGAGPSRAYAWLTMAAGETSLLMLRAFLYPQVPSMLSAETVCTPDCSAAPGSSCSSPVVLAGAGIYAGRPQLYGNDFNSNSCPTGSGDGTITGDDMVLSFEAQVSALHRFTFRGSNLAYYTLQSCTPDSCSEYIGKNYAVLDKPLNVGEVVYFVVDQTNAAADTIFELEILEL